ncbi:DJ-1/PfpI family protein [Actinoplanes sp. NEAU-A12]|uniref:DJ-1/PfpI family protein n=1 Tax=Actinoplanes sandaracinus TaxID=3045177 RepID=A0ABT6WRL1_9ACTN|nr:DJ-1/PfpI family protein [Actinoplanes sandaracinus]MDI6102378.1 DJ-1/PfpI family protein [Actinoplanes sandaracinus]
MTLEITVRRVLLCLSGIVLATAVLGAAVTAGVTATMRDGYPGESAETGDWPAPRGVPAGSTVVAVALGTSGTVVSDALLPYEALARVPGFFVYTVAEHRRPVPLSGGLRAVAEHTFATAPEPDVVVVPAIVEREPALRDWLGARDAYILGVCAGAEVLADAGLLAGRRATSFWQRLGALRDRYPETAWVAGERFVEDGRIITTAGVTSGLAGSLRLIELLAGPAEAVRVGREVSYRDWTPGAPTGIAPQSVAVADLPYALNAAFPWLRPVVGIGLTDGAGEIDIAAAFEAYAGTSFAARAVPVAAQPTVTTRHGLLLTAGPARVDRLIVPGADHPGPALSGWAADRGLDVSLPHAGRRPGEFALDPLLLDLATHSDRATAHTTAKYIEYPAGHLHLTGPAWPWRPTLLGLSALTLAAGAGLLPAVIARRNRKRRSCSDSDRRP